MQVSSYMHDGRTRDIPFSAPFVPFFAAMVVN
jgi:hypothetical protein